MCTTVGTRRKPNTNGRFWLILPAATAIGVRLSHASREGSALGRLLSNTWRTYRMLENNLGKLRIMLHSPCFLERCMDQSSGGIRWLCGLSGCREGNVLPSLRRVWVLGDIAQRWILRHESRPYGAQQARKLHNVGNHDAGTPSVCTMCRLSPSVHCLGRKCWVRRVPAAAVIPAARVVVTIIGPKASVAGRINAWVNRCAQRIEFRVDCATRDRERCGVLGG